MVEHLHRQLKAVLMKHAAHEHWVLPIALLRIRSSLKLARTNLFTDLQSGYLESSYNKHHHLLLVTSKTCCIDFANSSAANHLNPRASPMPQPFSTLL